MFGMNCHECGRGPAGAYLSAYQIALKHGYKGTEQEWINSLGQWKVVRAKRASGTAFECDTLLSDVFAALEHGIVPVMIFEDRVLAFPTEGGDDYIGFATLLYRDGGTDKYELYTMSRRGNTVQECAVSGSGEGGEGWAPGNNSIEYMWLKESIRASLDKAETAVQPEDVFVIRGYQSMAYYLADRENVRDGDYVLITGENGSELYRKDADVSATGLALIYVFVKGEGSGETASWEDVKPENGITIYDLANDVQQSIHRADTAMQPGKLVGAVAESTTQGGTVAKTALLANYTEQTNGIVLVHFTTPVEAGATISFTADGETFTTPRAIYRNGIAITNGIIGYGATAMFIFDGTNYNLLCVDSNGKNYGSQNEGKPLVVGQDGTESPGEWPESGSAKPDGGWAKSDLAQGVRDSLDLADTALQPGDVDLEDVVPQTGIPEEALSSLVQAKLVVAGQLIDVSQAVEAAETAAAAAEAAAEAAQTGANVITVQNILNHGDLHKGDTTGWAKKSGAGTLSYDSVLQALKMDGSMTLRINEFTGNNTWKRAYVEGHRYYVSLDAYSTTAASISLNGSFGNTTKQTIPAETWTHVVFAPVTATDSTKNDSGITWQNYSGQILYVKNIVIIDLDDILSGQSFPASDLRLILAGQYVDTQTITLQDYWESDAIRFPMDANMDTLLPLRGAYYTHAAARTAFPVLWRRQGQIIQFRLNASQTIRMRYKAFEVTDAAWANNENWEDVSNWPASHGMESFTTSPTIKASGIDYTTEDFFLEIVMEKLTPSGTGAFPLINFLSRTVSGQFGQNYLRVNQGKLQYQGSGGNYALNFNNSVLKSGFNHILMTRKDGTCETYVNGTLADTRTVAGTEFQYLEDITFLENCPKVALIRIGKNGDTVAEARFRQCSPLTYDASNDQVVVEARPQDFHAEGIVNRATGVFYGGALTPLAVSSYPDPIVGEGPPDVVAQFVGQKYYDSTNHKEYFSTGMTTAETWARYTTNLELALKQDALDLSNLKTVNGVSLLGSGNIEIGEEGTVVTGGIVVNVVEHGAKGNGVTDDTEAIMEALEIVRDAGGTIYFPYNNGNSTYLTRQGLVLEKSMCVHADPGVVLKNASAVLADDAGNPGTGQCALTQITAAVAQGDHTVTVQSTVGLAVGQQITIFDTDITKPQYQDTHCIITDITGSAVTFDNARWTADGTDGGAVGSYAIGSYVMTNFSLIETPFRNSNDIVVKNLTVQSCGNPQEPYCYTISPIHQTSQKKTAGSKQRRFTLINVTVDGSTQDGISVQGAGDITLINCTCKNVKWKGLHWGTSCDRVRVQGGLMDSCGSTAPSSDTVNLGNGGGGAMYFCIDNHDVIIDGVQVVNCRRGVFGFNNGSGGNGEVDTDSIITNCVFNNCERYGIEAGKGERLIVKGNLFRKFTGSAVPISLDQTETVTIEGNLFGEFADGYTNTLGAVKLSGTKQALVSGNNIKANSNATGSFGIVLAGCQDCLAIGNIAADVSVSDSGNVNVIKANNLELGESA